MTEKSAAFETTPLPGSTTSNAKRRAWVRGEEGNAAKPPREAITCRSVKETTGNAIPSRRGTELAVKPLPIIVSCGNGLGAVEALVRDETAMRVLGLVSTIESGRIVPSEKIETLLLPWFATTAILAPG